MKRRITALIMALCMVLTTMPLHAHATESEHVHDFTGSWTVNADSHWHTCVGYINGIQCDEKSDLASHNWDIEYTIRCYTCRYSQPHTHTGGTATCDREATCQLCGFLYGDYDPNVHRRESHQPIDANAHKVLCVCGATFMESEPHSMWEAGDKTYCFFCEYESTPVHTHSYSTATCTTPATCECGESTGAVDKSNHTGGTEIRDTKYATEFETGYTGDTYCLGCGDKLQSGQTIPATHVHSYATATCNTPATCECGESTGDVDKKNHTGGTEIRGAKDATEFDDGYTGDSYCKGCGDKLQSGQTIPATHQHNFGSYAYDSDSHWKVCACGDALATEDHHWYIRHKDDSKHYWRCDCGKDGWSDKHSDDNESGNCDDCGYQIFYNTEEEYIIDAKDTQQFAQELGSNRDISILQIRGDLVPDSSILIVFTTQIDQLVADNDNFQIKIKDFDRAYTWMITLPQKPGAYTFTATAGDRSARFTIDTASRSYQIVETTPDGEVVNVLVNKPEGKVIDGTLVDTITLEEVTQLMRFAETQGSDLILFDYSSQEASDLSVQMPREAASVCRPNACLWRFNNTAYIEPGPMSIEGYLVGDVTLNIQTIGDSTSAQIAVNGETVYGATATAENFDEGSEVVLIVHDGKPAGSANPQEQSLSWEEGYKAFCTNVGIINGRRDGTFEPSGSVTGVQALKMILAVIGYGKEGEYLGTQWNIQAQRTLNEYAPTEEGHEMGRDESSQRLFIQLNIPGMEATSERTGQTPEFLVTEHAVFNESVSDMKMAVTALQNERDKVEWPSVAEESIQNKVRGYSIRYNRDIITFDRKIDIAEYLNENSSPSGVSMVWIDIEPVSTPNEEPDHIENRGEGAQ